MLGDFVIRPTLHGVLGPWDEIINLIPLVVGVVLLAYLYVSSRRRPRSEDDSPPDEGGQPEPQDASEAGLIADQP